MIDFEEKVVCRKVANIFEMSGTSYDAYGFTAMWLNSENAKRLVEFDINDVAQSPLYLYKRFIEENTDLKYLINEDYDMSDVMYWIGYIITWIYYDEKIELSKILEIFDIKKMMCCYDTLHMLSTVHAIEEIKVNFRKE